MRIAVVACLCFGTVSAQEQLRVRPAEVQQEDVVAALGALGVDVLRFDFSDFTRENYDVAVYLDEADSTGTERLYTVRAGGTRQQLTRMPEEVRMGFRKELHLPETTTRLTAYLTTGDCTVTKGQPLPSQVETTRIARIGFDGRRIVSPPFSNSPTRSNVSPSALDSTYPVVKMKRGSCRLPVRTASSRHASGSAKS